VVRPFASNVTGAILAGGPATRLGGIAKGLARVGGIRIIDRVALALRDVTPDLLIVSNDPGASAWIDGVPVVADLYPGRASLLGIHAALKQAARDVVVVAWDMPFVPAALVRALTARREAGVSAVVPEGPHGPEPCCALYTTDALAHIEGLVVEGALKLGAMLHALPTVVSLALDDVRAFGDPEVIFTNVNTADDLLHANGIARPPRL
jgi:molybdopterin-guanine dinucleotide biosynthesis protein A